MTINRPNVVAKYLILFYIYVGIVGYNTISIHISNHLKTKTISQLQIKKFDIPSSS